MQTIEEIPIEAEVPPQPMVEIKPRERFSKPAKERARFSLRRLIWTLLVITVLSIGTFIVLVAPFIGAFIEC
jgi:cell division septal protein FtsQ